jgi:hypothetical protein
LPTLLFVHPVSTDSGVFPLLMAQYVALCCIDVLLISLRSALRRSIFSRNLRSRSSAARAKAEEGEGQ